MTGLAKEEKKEKMKEWYWREMQLEKIGVGKRKMMRRGDDLTDEAKRRGTQHRTTLNRPNRPDRLDARSGCAAK